jgi:predicted HD phosphohydrolase
MRITDAKSCIFGIYEGRLKKCYRDPGYHDKLSVASQGTLINQGGPMNLEEASAFESHPDFKAQWAVKAFLKL